MFLHFYPAVAFYVISNWWNSVHFIDRKPTNLRKVVVLKSPVRTLHSDSEAPSCVDMYYHFFCSSSMPLYSSLLLIYPPDSLVEQPLKGGKTNNFLLSCFFHYSLFLSPLSFTRPLLPPPLLSFSFCFCSHHLFFTFCVYKPVIENPASKSYIILLPVLPLLSKIMNFMVS